MILTFFLLSVISIIIIFITLVNKVDYTQQVFAEDNGQLRVGFKYKYFNTSTNWIKVYFPYYGCMKYCKYEGSNLIIIKID